MRAFVLIVEVNQDWAELLSHKGQNFLANLLFLKTKEVQFLGRQMTQKIFYYCSVVGFPPDILARCNEK